MYGLACAILSVFWYEILTEIEGNLTRDISRYFGIFDGYFRQPPSSYAATRRWRNTEEEAW